MRARRRQWGIPRSTPPWSSCRKMMILLLMPLVRVMAMLMQMIWMITAHPGICCWAPARQTWSATALRPRRWSCCRLIGWARGRAAHSGPCGYLMQRHRLQIMKEGGLSWLQFLHHRITVLSVISSQWISGLKKAIFPMRSMPAQWSTGQTLVTRTGAAPCIGL